LPVKSLSNPEINAFMRDITTQMASDYQRIRERAADDPGTAGDQGEINWKNVLEGWLPSSYTVVTKGRIINAKGDASPQVDVLVLKPSYPPKLRDQKYYLTGGVAAAFECKITLKAEHIEEAFANAAALRDILPQRSGSIQRELDSGIVYGLLAHSHVWKGAASTPVENIERCLYAADEKYVRHPKQMVDHICVSDLCFVTALKAPWLGPYKEADVQRLSKLARYGPRGCPATGYLTYAPNATSANPPVGALICHMMYDLALEDPSVRSMSAFFTMSKMSVTGRTYERLWDEKIYSPQILQSVLAAGPQFLKGIY
jgi:hypothetical protein